MEKALGRPSFQFLVCYEKPQKLKYLLHNDNIFFLPVMVKLSKSLPCNIPMLLIAIIIDLIPGKDLKLF